VTEDRRQNLDTGYSMLDARYSILDARYSILDARYSMLDEYLALRFTRGLIPTEVRKDEI